MADRDDKNLRHFVSRARQPRNLAAGKFADSGATATTPVQVNIILDQGFGSVSDQIDDNRFRYMGTASPVSRYESMCGRRTKHDCMASTFDWSK